jgi:hypothetical protein
MSWSNQKNFKIENLGANQKTEKYGYPTHHQSENRKVVIHHITNQKKLNMFKTNRSSLLFIYKRKTSF